MSLGEELTVVCWEEQCFNKIHQAFLSVLEHFSQENSNMNMIKTPLLYKPWPFIAPIGLLHPLAFYVSFWVLRGFEGKAQVLTPGNSSVENHPTNHWSLVASQGHCCQHVPSDLGQCSGIASVFGLVWLWRGTAGPSFSLRVLWGVVYVVIGTVFCRSPADRSGVCLCCVVH